MSDSIFESFIESIYSDGNAMSIFDNTQPTESSEVKGSGFDLIEDLTEENIFGRGISEEKKIEEENHNLLIDSFEQYNTEEDNNTEKLVSSVSYKLYSDELISNHNNVDSDNLVDSIEIKLPTKKEKKSGGDTSIPNIICSVDAEDVAKYFNISQDN